MVQSSNYYCCLWQKIEKKIINIIEQGVTMENFGFIESRNPTSLGNQFGFKFVLEQGGASSF